MKRKTSIVAALLFPAGLALAQGSPPMPASGESPPGAGRATFTDLDANSDGRLSKSEAALDAQISQRFAMLDDDGDGFVGREEYRKHMKAENESRTKSPGE